MKEDIERIWGGNHQAKRKQKWEGSAVDLRKRKSPEYTQQMVAVEEGTADNDDAKALKEIDHSMFEEGNTGNIELGDMGDSNDEAPPPGKHLGLFWWE